MYRLTLITLVIILKVCINPHAWGDNRVESESKLSFGLNYWRYQIHCNKRFSFSSIKLGFNGYYSDRSVFQDLTYQGNKYTIRADLKPGAEINVLITSNSKILANYKKQYDFSFSPYVDFLVNDSVKIKDLEFLNQLACKIVPKNY